MQLTKWFSTVVAACLLVFLTFASSGVLAHPLKSRTTIFGKLIRTDGAQALVAAPADKAEAAATAMGITAQRLLSLGLVDEVLPEPLGGAHRGPDLMAESLQKAIVAAVQTLENMDTAELLARRHGRLNAVGEFREN